MIFRILVLFMILFSSCLARFEKKDLKPYEGQVIANIDVVRKNIFDDLIASRDKSPFYYRWANGVHIMTREYVVRRELLFKVGDKLDLERVFETERNLRLSNFIGEVNVSAAPAGPDSVNLQVLTTDLWTTKISIYTNIAGGKYSSGVDLIEQNLLGWGKMVEILGQFGNDQNGYHLFYSDGRLLGTRLALDLLAEDFTFENGFSLNLGRPQYSLSVPISFSINYSHFLTRPRLFDNGKEYFRYKNDNEKISFEGRYSFGRFKRLSIIAGGNYEKYHYSPDDSNSPLNNLIPRNKTVSYPSVGLSGALIQYDVERYLDAPGTPEDLTLGASLMVKLGRSEKIFGASYTGYRPEFVTQFLAKPKSRIFVGGIEKIVWWRHYGKSERIRHVSEAALYYKPLSTHVLELHGLTDFAWRQDSTYQVFLGGGNGLRGHSFYALSGTKMAVANIEYRFYLPIEILTIRLGAAAFFDIGNAWKDNQHIRLSDLESDLGLGLRLGMTRSSTSRVVNFDLAKSLSHSGLFVTFKSSTSMFRLGDINSNE